eukprot:TRINITY_DN17244_c0_g1_i1.p2 TRINITY_DN17244_c0_g1~~TRINITY_DN17244_c0_g1_i1.p2  ORF type:complete len:285 (-),score=109.35 TRINITY_DN17244_c0_g1_i1:122-976(-)
MAAALSRLSAACCAAVVFLSSGGVAQDFEEPMDADPVDIEEESLTPTQLQALHRLMDSDGNGKLSLQEALAYSTHMAVSIAKKDVGAILEEIDTNKDGKVSLDEHVADIRTQADGGDEEEMKELAQRIELERQKFQAADGNRDGLLDIGELTALFYPETHDGVLAVTAGETLRQKDKNGDGKLSPHEFWEADVADGDDGELTEEEHQDFKALDLDGDGFLNIAETHSWESGKFHVEDAMKKMFEASDRDADMHLSADEMANARNEIALTDAQYHLIEWAEHNEL